MVIQATMYLPVPGIELMFSVFLAECYQLAHSGRKLCK